MSANVGPTPARGASRPTASAGWVSATLVLAVPLLALPAIAQAPTLVPAALSSVSPNGLTRGGKATFTLVGVSLQDARAVVFDDPAVAARIAGASGGQVKVEAEVGPAARVGVHSVYLRTPRGTTGAVPFAVSAWPEVAEKEPNDTPAQAAEIRLPATLTGSMNAPGDADYFRFRARARQEIVFQVVAAPLRSRIAAALSVLDAGGHVLAESQPAPGDPDPVLVFHAPRDGSYTLSVRDYENAAGGDVFYRINAGEFPYVSHVFSLGVPKGGGDVTLFGANLGDGGHGLKVHVGPHGGGWGATTAITEIPAGPLLVPVRVAVGDEPEMTERQPNHSPSAAEPVPVPVTVNGRIVDGGADYFRFHARRSEPLVLEVNARRLGSPLDSLLEVLDARGNPVQRATLRCVAQTAMTLSDRDSAASGMRLLSWSDFRINDLLYVGGEVIRINALPIGPDADVSFRSVRGQREGMLDTTPVGHAVDTPVYKVEVHPPHTIFPPNGMPVFHLFYRNDDGGPLYGKDSRITFAAPADGEYVVRIADVRGEQSDRHAYRLTIRPQRPDFRLRLSPEQPGLPAGASVPVTVSVDRLDGYAGPVDARLENLPPGITATPATIEAGEESATLLLTAAPDAKTQEPGRPPLRLAGAARIRDAVVEHAIEPAGGSAEVSILPKPDLTVRTEQKSLTLAPGGQQHLEATITRENGFAGRVPIDVRYLPFGVRVEDVGLNGVLITEGETGRRFTLYCEPWVKPTRRLIYCMVRTETGSSAPTDVAAEPILLVVEEPGSVRAGR